MPKSAKAKLASCYSCKYLARYKLSHLYPHERQHKKNLELTITRILTVKDFRSLHPCSDACKDQLRNLRKIWGKGKKALLRVALTSLHVTEKELHRVATNYALAYSSKAKPEVLERFKNQIKQVRITRGARQRRVNQLSESIANKELKPSLRLPFTDNYELDEREAIQAENN